ncbi:MAG: hypothetical protein NC038_00565 [Paludibacter sp.]|nr:hypothetical protein [Bacteroidales bacterium]MCM1068619.1 hypothetical protein [Prevotella sp.]MCM1353283.1 hypothetical protein [Bacteroides sp.]MCM1442309.1 hypothetical protein [Muribaculum sp.]MCM1481128.1 hypothetical protein [Paludibacter sp.]
MKKVLFVAAIACLAMGCCKKAANNECQEGACCTEQTECCAAEATEATEATEDTTVVVEVTETVETVEEVAAE